MNRQNLDRLIAFVRTNENFDMSIWSTGDLKPKDTEPSCETPCCLGGTCTFLVEGEILPARSYPELWTAETQYHSPGFLRHTRNTAAFLEIDREWAEKLCDPEGDAWANDEEDEDEARYVYQWPWDHLGGDCTNDDVSPEDAVVALEKVWTKSQERAVA
jgi:hypothetical protein